MWQRLKIELSNLPEAVCQSSFQSQGLAYPTGATNSATADETLELTEDIHDDVYSNPQATSVLAFGRSWLRYDMARRRPWLWRDPLIVCIIVAGDWDTADQGTRQGHDKHHQGSSPGHTARTWRASRGHNITAYQVSFSVTSKVSRSKTSTSSAMMNALAAAAPYSFACAPASCPIAVTRTLAGQTITTINIVTQRETMITTTTDHLTTITVLSTISGSCAGASTVTVLAPAPPITVTIPACAAGDFVPVWWLGVVGGFCFFLGVAIFGWIGKW